jgi:hypothetical protein
MLDVEQPAVCASPASCSGSENVHLCDTTAGRPRCADGKRCMIFSGYPGIGRCSM